MSWLDDLLGNTSADASNAAAADTYRKQMAASQGIKDYGDQYAGQFQGLSNQFQPYQQAGGSALQQLMAGLGLGGQGGQQQFTQAYQNLPGYQSGLNTGTQAAMRGLNAGGGLNSGGALKALQRFGSDYENQRSGDYLNRLTGLTSMGQQATGQNVATQGQGFQGQMQARQSAFGGETGAAPTIGQGQVAGAQAQQQGLTNLMTTGASLAGMALGGPMGGMIGGGLSKAAFPMTQQFPSTWIPAPRA